MDNPGKNWQHRVHKTKYKTKQKHNTICVGHYYPQANTNNTNKTTGVKYESNMFLYEVVTGITIRNSERQDI